MHDLRLRRLQQQLRGGNGVWNSRIIAFRWLEEDWLWAVTNSHGQPAWIADPVGVALADEWNAVYGLRRIAPDDDRPWSLIPAYRGQEGWDALADFYEIPYSDVLRIFDPSYYGRYRDTTPDGVADRIDLLLDRGTLDDISADGYDTYDEEYEDDEDEEYEDDEEPAPTLTATAPVYTPVGGDIVVPEGL